VLTAIIDTATFSMRTQRERTQSGITEQKPDNSTHTPASQCCKHSTDNCRTHYNNNIIAMLLLDGCGRKKTDWDHSAPKQST